MLRQKMADAADALEKMTFKLDTSKTAQVAEEAAMSSRLNGLRDELSFVSRREREAQEVYRARKQELDQLQEMVNGHG
jgi:pre-mRNA-splicing factor CDC5/CEF1